MKMWMLFAFGIVATACSSTEPATRCQSLQDCCDTLSNGAACAQYANLSDENACSSALLSLHQAQLCLSTDRGPAASGGGCDRYLSCLLASNPQAYGAAVQVYGEGSECWNNTAQSAGCAQACDASYAKIAASCSCEGSTCTKCAAPQSGSYTASGPPGPSTCGSNSIEITQAYLTVGAGNIGSMEVSYYSPYGGSGSVTLTGALDCSGASTLTGSSLDYYGCQIVVTATATAGPTDDTMILSGTWTESCGGQSQSSCTETVTLSR